MSILVQPTVANFRESELPFDDAKLVLHLRPDPGLVPVPGALFIGQYPVSATLGLRKVLGEWRAIGNSFFLAGIGGIAPHPVFFPMKQVGKHLGIVHVGRGSDHRMNELGAAVHTDVGLHPEVPLVALAGLVHVRIALLFLVLGRTRSTDDAGVNDGTSGDLQPVFLEVLIDQVEQMIAQIMFLHEMAEFANRCLIRDRLPAEIDTDELAQGTGVVKRFLDGRIGQIEPVLDEVDSQHSFDTDGATPRSFRIGIERHNGLGQFLPGYDGFHLFQKLFFAGLLAVLLKPGIRKGVLAHEYLPVLLAVPIINEHWN